MHIFNQLNKIIIATLTLITYWPQTQAMILTTSCLKRHVTPKITNKLVLLYDRHALLGDPISMNHVRDMKLLVNTLTKRKDSFPFFVEIAEAHKDPSRQNNMELSPSNFVIQLALNNNMRYKNINFIPFDSRNNSDFFVRDMILQTNEFAQAINNKYPFNDDFYTITAENFLNQLNIRHKSVINSIEQLPVSSVIKNQDHSTSKTLYANCYTTILALLKKYNVDSHKEHIFNLIFQLNNAEINALFLTLTKENCFSLDINLLKEILKNSKDHSLCILLAGSYHSNNIEKRLMSHYEGFEKDLESSMTLPGLTFDNLSSMHPTTNIPDNFMNKNMERFLLTE